MSKPRCLLRFFWIWCLLVSNAGCDDSSTALEQLDSNEIENDDMSFQADSSHPQSGNLAVLTYNVHGLPSVITMDDTPGRLRQIAPLLSDYDIVGLQEDFDDMNHVILAEGSGHDEVFRFGDILDLRFYGSGLSIFSKHPGIHHETQHYSVCHGRFDGASDCLASKGVHMVRVQVAEGVEIDVYNSHLEAGNGPDDQAAREDHVRELLEMMESHSGGGPSFS